MPTFTPGINARPVPLAVRGERGSLAASAAEEAIAGLREAIGNEVFFDGGRPVGSRDIRAWILHRRPVLAALDAEARALAATPWAGTLAGLIDKTECLRRRVPPRDPPDTFDDPELRAIRLHRAAQYREASVETRGNLEAGLREVAHATLRRARGRLEHHLAAARGRMRVARSEEGRRAATAEVHRYQQGLAALGDAERTPPEDPAETAKKILDAAERR